MTEHPDFDTSLDPADREVGSRLAAERPVPPADFRGSLGRSLLDDDPGYGPRPQRLRMAVVTYLGAGLALTALGALQAVGAL